MARRASRIVHTRCEFCGSVVTGKYGCGCELSTWIARSRRAWPGLTIDPDTGRNHANSHPPAVYPATGRADLGERNAE